MADPNHTAVLGAGVIGASWTALFLAAGKSVAIYDVADDVERTVRAYVENAWPTLTELGMTDRGNPEAVTFHVKPVDAVDRAAFVQESVPERVAAKHALYAEIEDALAPDAVIASSASGLTLSEMQAGWRDPARLVLGHPFNPPHLIPLVEVMGNDRTADGVVETAERFYQDVGKVTIRVNKEVPGHVANRLQAASRRPTSPPSATRCCSAFSRRPRRKTDHESSVSCYQECDPSDAFNPSIGRTSKQKKVPAEAIRG
ncbi:MAG: 3-hydroxyacyl-CoA dehydrogenase NAD-binding domain-containing protein [Alphaproteobacteria bacterium]|nr:3-hydroxyacyl-CoA dehydrogenase NAD-binding domain-containing protein [Alphaproteobacteria bacterium]